MKIISASTGSSKEIAGLKKKKKKRKRKWKRKKKMMNMMTRKSSNRV